MPKKKGKVRAYYLKVKGGKEYNTPVFASSARQAKQKAQFKAERLIVVSVRTPKPGEGKGGGWSRIRKDGKSPAKSKYGKGRGNGPSRKKNKIVSRVRIAAT